MRYQIENGTVSLGGKTILNHIDFSIKGQEKIAITDVTEQEDNAFTFN